MRGRLHPVQLGELAKMVQYAVVTYPEPKVKVAKHLVSMMPWEQNLCRAINQNAALPWTYDQLQERQPELLEFLIEYYTPNED